MKLTLEKQIPLAFLVALILLVTIGFFSYRRITTLNEAIKWEKHTQEILLELDDTLSLVVDAETSGRGFVITGDETFLEPFNHTNRIIGDNLKQLSNLLADNETQTQRISKLETLTSERLALIKQLTETRRTQGLASEISQISIRGKSLMDEIRVLVAQMKDEEKGLLVRREAVLDESIGGAYRMLILGSIAGILSLGLANLAIFRETGKRSHAEESLKDANRDLENRVEERTAELSSKNEQLKEQVERREESEERRKVALEVGGLGTWKLNLDAGEGELDERSLALFGLSTGEFKGASKEAFRRIIEEDMPMVDEAFRRSAANKENFQAEFRIRDKQNSIIWNQCTGTPQFDENGNLAHIVGFCRDITENKENELALRRSESFIRAVLDSLPAHISVLDKTGTIVAVNRAWNDFAAANRIEEQISSTRIGQNYLDVCENSAAFEKDTNLVVENLRAILKGEKKEFSFEYPYRSPIEEHWFILQASAMENGAVISHIDITARKLAEQALVERERLSLLNSDVSLALIQSKSLPEILQSCAEHVIKNLDAAFVRVWTLNQQENVLELEASAGMYTHLDGLHSRIPVGQNKIGRIAAERKPHLTNSVIGDPQMINQEWAKSEGMTAFAGYPLIIGERLVGVVAVFARQPLNLAALKAIEAAANIIGLGIERKQAETEREKILEREQAARKDAEIANRLRDDFLATVSHELRAPLNSILGWARLMQQGKLDEKTVQKAVETIVRNAGAQNHLIEDLLDVSRIISGKLRLEVMTIKPVSFVEAALESVRPAAEAKNITLKIQEDTGISHISGDPNRLQQVVWNLLSNAIKFTPTAGKVSVEIERNNSYIEIRVKDSGVGIKAEFLPHVFDRFSQADASSIRKFGGLGLGLAIVRHLTEMHGGTVRAHSAGEGEGSIFIVELPVTASPTEDETTININQSPLELETNLSLDGLLILVVDDEEDTRRLLVQTLTNYGATVTTANSAETALQAISNQQPDVLVSDIGMPDEDGYSLIRKVRALEIDIPAVALTAFTRAQDRMRALSSGFQNHVSKPVEPDELAMVIASLTGRL